jgi:excisionase family DNA binding protein
MEVQIKLPKELQTDIDFLKNQLTDLKKNFEPKKPTIYKSRSEVSKMLQVSYVTLNKWNKSGKLKAVGIGGRVLYRQEDIDNAIVEL